MQFLIEILDKFQSSKCEEPVQLCFNNFVFKHNKFYLHFIVSKSFGESLVSRDKLFGIVSIELSIVGNRWHIRPEVVSSFTEV